MKLPCSCRWLCWDKTEGLCGIPSSLARLGRRSRRCQRHRADFESHVQSHVHAGEQTVCGENGCNELIGSKLICLCQIANLECQGALWRLGPTHTHTQCVNAWFMSPECFHGSRSTCFPGNREEIHNENITSGFWWFKTWPNPPFSKRKSTINQKNLTKNPTWDSEFRNTLKTGGIPPSQIMYLPWLNHTKKLEPQEGGPLFKRYFLSSFGYWYCVFKKKRWSIYLVAQNGTQHSVHFFRGVTLFGEGSLIGGPRYPGGS